MQTIKLHPAFYPLVADGRKTQTRRVVKETLGGRWELFNLRRVGALVMALLYHDESVRVLEFSCPYTIGEIVKWGDGEGRILDIRCERLQDISEEDAVTEGVAFEQVLNEYERATSTEWCHPLVDDACFGCPAEAFQDLWHNIYPDGPESWESNPCVWALTIERQTNDE